MRRSFVLAASLALAQVSPGAPFGTGDGAVALPPDTIAVVTTDGLFVPSATSSTPQISVPSAACPGASSFVRPAVEWEPGTSCLLVAAGPGLFRVCVDSLAGGLYTVVDVTPATATPMDLYDLDVNPGTGELYLFDQATGTVERYAPPFAAGMVSDLSIPVPAGTRCMALDSRTIPASVLAGGTAGVTRLFPGGASENVSDLAFVAGVDQDPQKIGGLGTYVTSGSNQVGSRARRPTSWCR
ncbi:MAG: hypothetical protein AAF682_16765 [Planctomycetota bacterium]